MLLNKRGKEFSLREKIHKAPSLRSSLLHQNRLSIYSNDQARRTLSRLKSDAEMKIRSLTSFNLSEVERVVNRYLNLKSYAQTQVGLIENLIKDFAALQEKIANELKAYESQLSFKQISSLKAAVRNKCESAISAIRDQINYVVDESLGVYSMEFESTNDIYKSYKEDLKSQLVFAEKEKARQHQLAQQQKAIEEVKIKERQEARLDDKRDAEIEKVKKACEQKAASYKSQLEEEKEAYLQELLLKHKQLEFKEESIEKLLRIKQEEMLNNFIKQKDNIINDLAEAKAAEILKKLGIKI